jgi:CRP/FNR family transcriptional regulator, cyclic AMP receptor protein
MSHTEQPASKFLGTRKMLTRLGGQAAPEGSRHDREEIMPELSKIFDVATFLGTAGIGKKMVSLRRNTLIFAQGDNCEAVFYVQSGSVQVSVVSAQGKEATIAILNGGDFVGEECISAAHQLRTFSATALTDASLLQIDKLEMSRVLRDEPAMSARFVSYLLTRTSRVQADLIDQLFNSSEKRLARILLLLAHFGEDGASQTLVPKVSQETLADMIGTTRSRVNFFLNRFRQLGYIEYGDRIQVNNSLLQVVLHD